LSSTICFSIIWKFFSWASTFSPIVLIFSWYSFSLLSLCRSSEITQSLLEIKIVLQRNDLLFIYSFVLLLQILLFLCLFWNFLKRLVSRRITEFLKKIFFVYILLFFERICLNFFEKRVLKFCFLPVFLSSSFFCKLIFS